MTHFAERYEKSVFSLDSLTPHQIKKLEEIKGTGDRHIEAPAGAGKTFVALHRMLQVIAEKNDKGLWVPRDTGAVVIFVARNQALAYFVARWLSVRFIAPETKVKALAKLHALFKPLKVGPRKCIYDGGKGQITYDEVPREEQVPYALFVVDEAHHIYHDQTQRADIEKYVTLGTTQRLLLSTCRQ